ncbi:ulp1 protease family, C-terminal catalytic domain-containing protein [Tanacetum coccineum]
MCGEDPKEEDHSEFCKRVFPKIDNLKGEHLLKLPKEDVKFNQLDDEDAVRVCLLLALDFVFMGQELKHRDYNVVADPNHRKHHLDKLASNLKYEANYVLYSFVFPLKVTPSTPVLRSSTRGSSNSKSVHTCVRTEVCHEVHVRTEVRRFVDKEEVRTQAVDQEDLLERAILGQTFKDQHQMIIDLQRRLLSVKQVTKKLRTGPSNVDHLDKNKNQYNNVLVGGLDHQSIDGVSQCMNVDRLDKNCNDVRNNFHVNGLDHQSMEGVSHCTSFDRLDKRLNEVDESVAIDGLIRLRSQDVDHTSKESLIVDDNDFKVKDNKEAYFLSTQQVRELMEEVFDTPSGPDSTQDVGGSESINVDQPYLVKNVKDVNESDINTVVVPFQRQKFPVIKTIVDSDGNEIQLLPWIEDLTRSPNAPKRTVTVHEPIMSLFRDKNRMELRWTFPWVEDGHVHLKLWIDYLWQFKEPNDDWAMASPYLSDMLSWYEYPLYYANGVKYGLPWFASNVEKVYFPVNKKDSHWVLAELDIFSGVITIYDTLGALPCGIETRHFLLELRQKFKFYIPLYLDNAEVLSHKIPLEVDDPINFALAYRERMIEFYWKYKMLL